MEIAMFAVQLGIVAAAIWYSFETRKLRLQNESEIKLLAKQGRLSLAPFLVPGVHKVTKAEIEQLINKDDKLSDEEKQNRKKQAENIDVFYIVQVDNPTADKVGCHLEPYIYDPTTKSFLTPDHGKEWVSPKDRELFQVTGPYVTHNEVLQEITKSYGNVIMPLLKQQLDAPADNGYIALFYQDVEGTIYLSKRAFIMKDGKIVNRPTQLFCATF